MALTRVCKRWHARGIWLYTFASNSISNLSSVYTGSTRQSRIFRTTWRRHSFHLSIDLHSRANRDTTGYVNIYQFLIHLRNDTYPKHYSSKHFDFLSAFLLTHRRCWQSLQILTRSQYSILPHTSLRLQRMECLVQHSYQYGQLRLNPHIFPVPIV